MTQESSTWHDSGSDLKNIVEAWEAGLRGEVPKCLAKYHEVSLKAEEYRLSRLGK